jgi:putative ABC transport system permease protein
MTDWTIVRSGLSRNPFALFLTLVAVTAGFTLFSLMIALDESFDKVIEAAREDRLYVNSRFEDPKGLPIALEEQIKSIDGISGVGAFRWVSGYFKERKNSIGVYTVDEGMRVAWAESPLTPEQWTMLFKAPTGVFATEQAAQRWALRAGSRLSIVVPPGARSDGAREWTFEVLGVIPDSPDWGGGGVIIGNYPYAENARPVKDQGYVVGYRVALSDPKSAAKIARRVDERFANSGSPTISVPARANAEAQVRSGVAIASMTWGVGTAGLFMIAFLTGNAIMQSVKGRLNEFAALKGIGFTDLRVSKIICFEAIIPCIFAASLGIGIAAALSSIPDRLIPRSLSAIPHPSVSLETLGWSILFATLIALIGAAFPILMLWRLNVAAVLAGRTS